VCNRAVSEHDAHMRGRGQHGTHQLNLLEDVERVVNNAKHAYWRMRNGYCLPVDSETMARLCARLFFAKTTRVPSLATEVYNALVSLHDSVVCIIFYSCIVNRVVV
jgi:hypothetical protein